MPCGIPHNSVEFLRRGTDAQFGTAEKVCKGLVNRSPFQYMMQVAVLRFGHDVFSALRATNMVKVNKSEFVGDGAITTFDLACGFALMHRYNGCEVNLPLPTLAINHTHDTVLNVGIDAGTVFCTECKIIGSEYVFSPS